MPHPIPGFCPKAILHPVHILYSLCSKQDVKVDFLFLNPRRCLFIERFLHLDDHRPLPFDFVPMNLVVLNSVSKTAMQGDHYSRLT